MEGDGLRAEGEFLVLFGLCQERLESRVLETALVSLCSTRENHEQCCRVAIFGRLAYVGGVV